MYFSSSPSSLKPSFTDLRRAPAPIVSLFTLLLLLLLVSLLLLTSTSSSRAQSAHGLRDILGNIEQSSSSSRLEVVRKGSLGAFLISSPLSQSTLPRSACLSWSLWAGVKMAWFSYQNLSPVRSLANCSVSRQTKVG